MCHERDIQMSVFRRLTGLLVAAFVSASAVAQVGCGVVHCVEPVVAAAEPQPSCHPATDSADAPSPAHQSADGHGACCITHPAEKIDPASAVAAPLDEALEPHLSASVLPSRAGYVRSALRETGPPGWVTGSARLPLRL